MALDLREELDLRPELDVRPESGLDLRPELDIRAEDSPSLLNKVLAPLFAPANAVRNFFEPAAQKIAPYIPNLGAVPPSPGAQQFVSRLPGAVASAPVDPTTYAFGGIAAIPNMAARVGLGAGVGALSAAAQTPQPEVLPTAIGAVMGGVVGGYVPKPSIPSMKPSQLLGSTLEKAQVDWVDQFAPIAHFTETIKEATGKTFAIDQDPYVAARLYAGLPGRINARVRELGAAIQPAKGQERELSLALAARRSLERSARGFENPTEVRIGGKIESIANPGDVLDQLEQALGPEKFKAIGQASDNFSNYFNTKLLPDLLDSGVL